jgi:hypothetical protein
MLVMLEEREGLLRCRSHVCALPIWWMRWASKITREWKTIALDNDGNLVAPNGSIGFPLG